MPPDRPYAPGAQVRILCRPVSGHARTPAYVMGARGRVLSLYGPVEDPELRAYGRTGPVRRVYRVRIAMEELWPETEAAGHDAIEIEVYEHWLRPEESPSDAP